MEQGTKTTGAKRKLFNWSMKLTRKIAPWRCGEGSATLATKLQWALADKLVYSKIRARTGGRLRLVMSGGAPLFKDLTQFFWAIGIPIYQGYGLTETSPILTSTFPQNRVGSSGRPIANVQVRIADDGEILAKGPCVMQGYFKDPRPPVPFFPKTAGSAPATSVFWTGTSTSSSPTARRTSSKPPPENLLLLSPSKTCSKPARTSLMPWLSATSVNSSSP